MSMMRTGLLVVGLAGCGGPDVNFRDLLPILAVSPPLVDFGGVGVPLDDVAEAYVSNAGQADLEVDVTVVGGLGAFSLEGAEPTLHLELEPGEEQPLLVRFAPETYREYEGQLLVTSNDELNPTATIGLRGTGIDLPLPDIEIAPNRYVDAGVVNAGEAPLLTFDIVNAGDAELVIESVTLEGDDTFALLTPPLIGTIVFPGNSTTVIARYEPDDTTGDGATVTIVSNDLDEPSVDVRLSGNGGNGFELPVAVIDCPATVLLTGPEWTRLDGSGSTSPTGGELTYEWTVLVRPPGSDADVPLDPDDTPQIDLYTDIAGLYTVQLVVRDEFDTPSLPAPCAFSAVPEDDVHVELSWDSQASDVDLHLAQEGFALYDDPEDVAWCNQSPNWGEAGNDDDPRLDIDNTNGLGPENINILVPEDGGYVVRVHYFDDKGAGPIVATTRVWVGGTELAVEQRVMEENDVWDVGTIEWPAATFTVDATPNYPATVRTCP